MRSCTRVSGSVKRVSAASISPVVRDTGPSQCASRGVAGTSPPAYNRIIRAADSICSCVAAPASPNVRKAFRRSVEAAGFIRPGAPITDEQCVAYFGHFYEFVSDDAVHTIGEDYASETVRRFFDANGPHRDVLRAANVPPSFVIVQRINLGLYALLARLRATANWRRLGEEVWPWVDGPPSTPLGELEAEWHERTRK